MILEQDLTEKIETFKESCTNLDVSFTPKFHILFHHVKKFIEAKGEHLDVYSEQSSQVLHFDFGFHRSHCYKVSISNPDYEKKAATCHS